MLGALLSVYSLALLSPLICRRLGRAAGWGIALLPAGLALWFAGQIPAISAGQTVLIEYPWVELLEIRLAFLLDGLSLLMALLITGIGALVTVFSAGYLSDDRDAGRFYCFLLLFMGSMLGLVLSDDLIALFVFWELTSFSSFLLIGFEHERGASRAAALQALLVTSGAGLALLPGFLLLRQAGGSLSLSVLLAQGPGLAAHPLYVPIVLLILLGALAKSAQFPLHFWLPSAMVAPAPVSAYLHAATMVKAGIYLLARLHRVLGESDLWQVLLMSVGGLTVLAGALLALQQQELKRLLAYSTVVALGTMTLLLGVGGPDAIWALVVYLVAHALYKGALFLVAGALAHAAGESRADRLGGLARSMPTLALAALLAGASMAGVPLLLGFMGKELLLHAVTHGPWAIAVTVTVILVGAVLAAAAGQVALRPFIGKLQSQAPTQRLAPALWLGPLVLAGAGVLLGLAPGLLQPLATAATAAVHGRPIDLQLHLWGGLTLSLLLGSAALAAGALLFLAWDRLYTLGMPLRWLGQLGPARGYELALLGLRGVSAWQTQLLQSGYLRYYMMIMVLSTVALVGGMLLGGGGVELPHGWARFRLDEAILAGLIIAAALATIGSRSWLAAISALGVVGLGVAVTFAFLGAPDLAMTQFLVETFTVILFVLIIYHLPRLTYLRTGSFLICRVLVAGAAGLLMSLLVLAAAAGPAPREVAHFYLRQSLPQGLGRNVVNVILVDFRAMDTLGEITVLAVAALGVFALVRLGRRKRSQP